jgi:hypothetical protein
VKYGQYAREYATLADAQVKTAEMFGFDYVSAISDPAREAADTGAALQWFDDQPPAIIEEHALLLDKAVLGRLRPPELIPGGRMEDRVRGIELLRRRVGSDLFVEGWVEGPCAEAADLRGINRLMTDFSDDPEFVRELFEFTVETAIRFAAAQIRAGADIIGVGDAAASLVGPRIYKEFVWPWEKKLVDGIHAAGGHLRKYAADSRRDGNAGLRNGRHRFSRAHGRGARPDGAAPNTGRESESGEGCARRNAGNNCAGAGIAAANSGSAVDCRGRMRDCPRYAASEHTGHDPVR